MIVHGSSNKNHKIRINVQTPKNLPPWKNIEITGYVKIDSLINSTHGNSLNSTSKNGVTDIDWVSRTSIHNEYLPCSGLSLHGGIYPAMVLLLGKRKFGLLGDIPKKNLYRK